MNKLIKSFFAIVASLGSLPFLEGANASALVKSDVKVWSTYSNTLVLQDNSSYTENTIAKPVVLTENNGLVLETTMGQGETEGLQLIISPEKAVSSFSLVVSDLNSGSNTISKDNIEVFQQYYLEVKEDENYNKKYNAYGMYPDILVPLKWSMEAEENYIEAGKNQGLSIDVTTNKDTLPGEYTGSFKLKLDSLEYDVPVTVNVRDVDLSKSYLRSIAASATPLNKTQYEWMMEKYRILPQFPNKGSILPENLLEGLEYYWNDPHFNAYEIPNSSPEIFEAYLRFIAKNSTASRNYLTRASCYLQNVDEPNGVNGPEEASAYCAQFKAAKERVINDLPTYFPTNPSLVSSITKAIRELPLLLTLNLYLNEHTAARFNADMNDCSFCLSAGVLNYQEIQKEFAKESQTPLWEYNNSPYPECSHSLPNTGTSMRSKAWGCFQNDYVGQLFWDIDATDCEVTENRGTAERYRSRNYFQDIYSFASNAGDGSIVFPGSRFGRPSELIPTSRLRSGRDGVEDHSLLMKIKETYESTLLMQAGLNNYDFYETFNWICSKALFNTGVQATNDDQSLFEMRDLAFDLYDLAKSQYGVINGGVTYSGNKALMKFYAKCDSMLVDGKTITGTKVNGTYTLFEIEFNASELKKAFSSITFGEGVSKKTFKARIFEYGELYNALDNISDSSKLTSYVASSPKGMNVSAGNVEMVNGKLVFTLSKGSNNALDNIGYNPEIKFRAKLFDTDDIFNVHHLTFKTRIKYNKDVPYLPIQIFDNQSDSYKGYFNSDFLLDDSFIGDDGYYSSTISFNVKRVPASKLTSLSFELNTFHGDKIAKYFDGATIEISDIYYSKYSERGNA